ncbi:MAG: alpha/beta hydrolase [Proteobacteria bacterium]|nr:alpha/beta hydrolase [Pseudomonadota bacterium]
MHEIRTQTVSTLGGRLDIKVNIAGSGDPVVYLHSAGGFYWDDFLDGLADKHTVYAPYFPGTEPNVPDPIDQLDELWDVVLAYDDMLDELGLDSTKLIGHSFGGLLASELAAQRRKGIEKLVLIAPIGLYHDDHPYTCANWCALSFDQILDTLFFDSNTPRVKKRMTPPLDPDEAALWTRDFIWTLGCTGKLIWPIPDKGLDKRIHRITAPSLVVWGENDALIPTAYGEIFKNALPNADLFWLSECGHEPPLEQTEKLSAEVASFFAR